MKCPVCTTPELLMSERQGIEIDYCPQCRGVWLDRGELDKIIERSTRDAAPVADSTSSSTPSAHSDQPYYYLRHGHDAKHGYDRHGSSRKKSVWQELFD